jgi:hypothetical protein
MSIEAMKLTDPHDHPEPHTMKWTQLEMDYINKRVEAAVRQAIEQAEKQEPVEYTGNGTAGREADVRPTGFFFQADKKQEPVAYAAMIDGEIAWDAEYPFSNEPFSCFDDEQSVPLYTAPPQRKPIPHPPAPTYCTTEEERKSWVLGWLECEAAHGIKENT